MDFRGRLFLRRDPYGNKGGDGLFVRAMREAVEVNAAGCPEYAAILASAGFDPDDIKTIDDIALLPPVPTLYLKRRRLFSVPEKKLIVKATSSGTHGSRSVVGLDMKTLLYGLGMMFRFFRYHGVISLIPVNYIVLGYEPKGGEEVGAVKTAYGTTKFAPALHREYALKAKDGGYEPNYEGVYSALMRYSAKPFPVRFVGFPAYMYFLCDSLKERGVKLKLPKRSAVLLGGGWKQFSDKEISKEEFYSLVEEYLGIKRERVFEFYSAAEHPQAYLKCPCGHFHVPAYSRVVIRSAEDLSPVPDGEPGLLNFVSPLVHSMPINSVLTDDIAVLSHEKCPCGLEAPYFELLGRAGAEGVRTCAAEAAELLRRA